MHVRLALWIALGLTLWTGTVSAQVRSYPGQSRAAAVIISSGVGAPTGTFGKGTFALDTGGDIWICNTNPCTTGGHWVQVNVDAAAVAATTFDAHTILAAVSDNTPVAVTVAEDRIVGRLTGGNITALTGAQVGGVIGLGDLSDVGPGSPNSSDVLTWDGNSWEAAAPAGGTVPPIMLFCDVIADTNTLGTTTNNAPIRTTPGISWTFPIDAAALETIYGAGAWKITVKVLYSTENALDDVKFQLYNLGTSTALGTDPTLSGSILFALGSVSWSTNLPTTLSRLNIAFYNGTATGAGHTVYVYSIQAYAEAD